MATSCSLMQPSRRATAPRCSGSRAALRVTCVSSPPAPAVQKVPATQPPSTIGTLSLKEWAVAIGALGNGEQTILFRKGGIKEPSFKPEAKEFLFFPTSFHTEGDLLKPGVAARYEQEMKLEPKAEKVLQLPYYAQITGAWTTEDAGVVAATGDLHVWTEAFVESRLKWRKSQPITVLELRVWKLASPLQLPVTDSLFGCFSWVDLSAAVAAQPQLADGIRPVLSDEQFAERQQRLRRHLATLPVTVLEE